MLQVDERNANQTKKDVQQKQITTAADKLVSFVFTIWNFSLGYIMNARRFVCLCVCVYVCDYL